MKNKNAITEMTTKKSKTKSTQKQNLITEDMTIADAVNQFPSSADVFLRYGLHCIGCHVSPFETLAEGAASHGIEHGRFQQMIHDANKAAQKEGNEKKIVGIGKPSTIMLTSAAVERINSMKEKQGKKDWVFRIKVVPGGCSGMSYQFMLDEKAQADDIVEEKDGFAFVIDQDSLNYLQGSTIDFKDTLQESGFKISNPQAKRSCSCGKSFS